MKPQNITPEQITNELYNIFSDDRRAVQYMTGTGEQYTGLLGWAGVMSPENRAAFIKAVTEGLQIMGYYDAEYIKTLYRSELVRHGYITPQEL